MGDGYDYDYLLPRGTLPRVLTEMAGVWPAWVLEGERNTLLSRGAFSDELPPSAHSGFVLYRDAAMRERFHRDGGFVDEDGSSPIVVWISGSDESFEHADFVIDLRPPSVFLGRFQDTVAAAIAATSLTIEAGPRSTRYSQPMDSEWVARNWSQALALEPALQATLEQSPTLRPLLTIERDSPPAGRTGIFGTDPPSGSAAQGTVDLVSVEQVEPAVVQFIERSVIRLLGCWHRIAYHPIQDERGHGLQAYTMPPGDVVAVGTSLDITGRGRLMTWTPTVRPTIKGSGAGQG